MPIIGGTGVIVEIEEFFLKTLNGEEVCIFAGIERHPNGRLFAKLLEDRSENTLQQLFLNSIARGSIIISNMGFASLELLGYSHYPVDDTLKKSSHTLRYLNNKKI